MLKELKELAGVILKDSGRYSPALYTSKHAVNGDPLWVHLKNRHERLVINPVGHGVECDWQWSSRLHACEVLPFWGRRLMQRALADWPIRFSQKPVSRSGPKVSFNFAHAGEERLPLLLRVIQTAFAQRDVTVECVVVDQSPNPCRNAFPPDVVYKHLDTSQLTHGWRKSWAYNIAARAASADIFIFHDGDICAPERYAAEVVKHLVHGNYETASIQRFLFYLSQQDTQQVLKSDDIEPSCPETVLQNWTGGTIAIRRDAFFRIGGFDERFVDWGGEDGEFFDRCQEIEQVAFGYMPLIHLWHRPQRGRRLTDNPNTFSVLPSRLAIPPQQRIAELSARDFGRLDGRTQLPAYKDAIVSDSVKSAP